MSALPDIRSTAAQLAVNSLRAQQDPRSPIDAAITMAQFQEWLEKGASGLLAEGVRDLVKVSFDPDFAGSGMGILLLTSIVHGWKFLLGGTCHKSLRGTPHCASATGVHGPWVTSSGELVKFRADGDRAIVSAALAAWHPDVAGESMATVTESGIVTVTDQGMLDDGSAREFSLDGGDARATIYSQESRS